MKPSRPKVKAILICDQIIHEALSNKKSLIGIFEDIHLAQFPCRYPRVAVYVNLTDAHGHYSLGVRLLDADGNQIGAGKTPAVEIVDKRHTCEFALQIQNLEFKKPGTYEFQILANDDLLETKSFNVKQIQRPPARPGA